MLTFKLSHFHLDDVLLIAILVQKQTFKKKVCPKIRKLKLKNFPKKNTSPEISILKSL